MPVKAIRAFLVVVIATTLVVTNATPARADAIRVYSVGMSNGQDPFYTGVHSFHAMADANIVGGIDCFTRYGNQSNFIALTQWVMVNLSSTDPHQIELGHAQQCADYNFYFWGYWFNGVFNELGWSPSLHRHQDLPTHSAGHLGRIFRAP